MGIFLAAIIAQLIARSMTDWEAMKNVLTVSAILTVLPMANLASPLLVMLRIPSMSRELYEKCRQSGQEERLLYELVITSKDLILPVDAVLIHPSGTICYCPKKDISTKKAEEYLNGMLGKWKLNKNARVITEEPDIFKTAWRHASRLRAFGGYGRDLRRRAFKKSFDIRTAADPAVKRKERNAGDYHRNERGRTAAG